MESSKFDKQIQSKQEELASLRSTLEELSLEFVQSATHFIPGWCNAKVITTITNDPKATMALGQEKLAAFKAELNRFLDGFPAIIERALDNDAYWPHRQALPSKPRHKIPNFDYAYHASRTVLHEGIRELFGHVGTLLIERGFATAESESGEWRMKYAKPADEAGVLEYAYSFDWDEKMETVWKRYLKRYDQMLAINDELKALEIEKAKAEVQNLWEKL